MCSTLNLYSIKDKQINKIAMQLSTSIDDIKKTVPNWKETKSTQDVINAYVAFKKQDKKPKDLIPVVSIYDLLQKYPSIQFMKCHDAQPFQYKPFPISAFPKYQPSQGIFCETFIAIIPKGEVFSKNGYVKTGHNIMAETWYENQYAWQLNKLKNETPVLKNSPHKFTGRVAVITQTSEWCYFIWMTQVLERLRMIEESGLTYDWIYVTCNKPFMKETLKLFNIDPAKIIDPEKYGYIQADELLVPSLPTRKTLNNNKLFCDDLNLASFCSNEIIHHLQQIFLPLTQNVDTSDFSKKIFISRKDSANRRLTTNEDEIFSLFEPFGFKRYCLTDFSVLEQAALFNNANIIVATHGAALTNLIFCKPHTKVIEIFQARSSCTYWYMSQQLNLDYFYIKTMNFDAKNMVGTKNLAIPLEKIQEFSASHSDILSN